MNRRMESVRLMACLQPFTQLGQLSASAAQAIVEDYRNGDTSKLRSFINTPTMPNNLTPILEKVKQFM